MFQLFSRAVLLATVRLGIKATEGKKLVSATQIEARAWINEARAVPNRFYRFSPSNGRPTSSRVALLSPFHPLSEQIDLCFGSRVPR